MLQDEYALRLAPYNIARIKLERLARDRAFIHWVYVPPAFRGRGLGQVLLDRVLADADREGVHLALVAKACAKLGAKPMGQNPLEGWYAQNGFIRRGRAADGGMKMSRRPFDRVASRRHKRV